MWIEQCAEMWIEKYAEMFAPSVVVSILVVNATLLGLTSLRNQHVSDRARANVIEALHQLPASNVSLELKLERLKELKTQNKEFIKRYQITSRSFLLLVLTLCLFAASSVLSPTKCINSVRLLISGLCAIVASLLGLSGLYFLICEFIRGPKTLMSNNTMLDSLTIGSSKTKGVIGRREAVHRPM